MGGGDLHEQHYIMQVKLFFKGISKNLDNFCLSPNKLEIRKSEERRIVWNISLPKKSILTLLLLEQVGQVNRHEQQRRSGHFLLFLSQAPDTCVYKQE